MGPGPAPWPFGGAGAPRGRARRSCRATVGGLRPPKPPRLRRGFAPSKPGPRARPLGPGLPRRPTSSSSLVPRYLDTFLP